MEIDYTKFYMRASPYLIGIGAGYLTCRIQTENIKIKLASRWVVMGWIVATCLCLSSVYGIVPFTDFIKNEYSNVDAAFYLSLGRVAWGLGLAWIVLACLHGYGGTRIINSHQQNF